MRAITNPAVNIPISTSILHEQEYNNISLILKYIKKSSTRRSISDKRNKYSKKIDNDQRSISISFD
jgi:hypothetical protein